MPFLRGLPAATAASPGIACLTPRSPAKSDKMPPRPQPAPPTPASVRPWAETARLVAVVLAALLVWIIHSGRVSTEAWHLPTEYTGDAHEMLARVKASSEGDLIPLLPQRIERLNAPLGANWNAYPTPDKLPLLLLGGVARLTDLFFAANLGLMAAFGLTAGAFYWCVRRWLGAAWEWAAAGALLFAFNSSVLHRGLSHFSFVMNWVIPLGLLACWLIAGSRRLHWGSREMWVCFGASFLLGFHNTYYLYFWLPLVVWAAAGRWFETRQRTPVLVAAACLGLAATSFFLSTFEYWVYSVGPDAAPLLERNYGGTERYALKFVELFIPPATHRVDLLAFLGQRYQRWSEFRGESHLPYLGLAGLAALLWLVAATLPRLFRSRPLPGAALASGWLTAFGTTGGINSVLAFFGGLFVFRATNRIGVFLAAVLLVFLVGRLSRVTRGWRPAARLGTAGLVAALGLLDQLPDPSFAAATQAQVRAAVDSDRTFGRALEERLPDDAMVFQLPVLLFPETTPPWRLRDYEHFRPYLATSTLRFSYGAAKFRPRIRWQQELENLAAPALARRLEELGFSALYLNRRGFEDSADRLLADLARAGYTDRLDSPLGNQVALFLRPDATPALPFARSLTYGRGWHNRPVDGIRWAHSDATLLYFNPLDRPVRARVRLWMHAPDERSLSVRHGTTLLAAQLLPGGEQEVATAEFLLPPGNVVLHLATAEDALSTGGQRRKFGIRYSLVERLD